MKARLAGCELKMNSNVLQKVSGYHAVSVLSPNGFG